ncbi:MAG TPA: S1 RNA-binding domain-containing protein, partial [Thermoanaerobaculia bacterium]|nr:S1 RNA-binding domain-containing protein [Thermoanaerobaculia bacterium]
LADRVGERFRGRVTGVQAFGLFVQLDGYYVDGLVPIRTLGDDYYVFEPEAHRLVGERSRQVFQLADPVEVELTGVDLRHRGLDFRLAATAATAAAPPAGKPPRSTGSSASPKSPRAGGAEKRPVRARPRRRR